MFPLFAVAAPTVGLTAVTKAFAEGAALGITLYKAAKGRD